MMYFILFTTNDMYVMYNRTKSFPLCPDNHKLHRVQTVHRNAAVLVLVRLLSLSEILELLWSQSEFLVVLINFHGARAL